MGEKCCGTSEKSSCSTNYSMCSLFKGLICGPMRCFNIMCYIFMIVITVLAVICAIRFFRFEDINNKILYATLFLTCVGSASAMKMWLWLGITRNIIQDDIAELKKQIEQQAK